MSMGAMAEEVERARTEVTERGVDLALAALHNGRFLYLDEHRHRGDQRQVGIGTGRAV